MGSRIHQNTDAVPVDTEPTHVPPTSRPRLPHASSWIATLGILLSFAAYLWVFDLEERGHQHEFELRTQDRTFAIEQGIDNAVNAVDVVARLMATGPVDASRFRRFSEGLFPSIPGLRAVEWLPLITPASRPAFEAKLAAQGKRPTGIAGWLPDGTIGPSPPKPELFPIEFIEPELGSEYTIGFDQASQPDRHRAMLAARASRSAAASAVTTVRVNQDRFEGIFLFAPAFSSGSGSSTTAGARDQLVGYAAIAIDIRQLVETTVGRLSPAGVHFHLLAAASNTAPAILHFHPSRLAPGVTREQLESARDHGHALSDRSSFTAAGQTWILEFISEGRYAAWQSHRGSLATFAVGILLSLTTAGYVGLARNQAQEIEERVRARTAELAISNARLANEVIQRRDAEQTALLREREFESLAEHSPDIIIRVDANERFLYGNGTLGRISGLPASSWIGRTARELGVAPHVCQRWEEVNRRVFDTGHPEVIEFEMDVLNGRRTFESRIIPEHGQNGIIDHLLIISRDITEARRSANAAEEMRTQLQAFVEQSPVAMAMLDRELRYIAASQRWIDDYKLTDLPLTGKRHYDVFPEIENLPEWKAIHQAALEGRLSRREEDFLTRPDGSTLWIRWEARPWLTSTGTVGGIILWTENITARKQAELALTRAEERLRIVSSATNDAVWDWDLVTDQVLWNPAFFDRYGHPPTDGPIPSAACFQLVHPDDLPRMRESIGNALNSPEQSRWEAEHRFLRADGRYAYVYERASILRDQDHRPIRMIGALTDVTPVKEAEAELREVNLTLERRVQERTDELRRAVRLMAGREVRMAELKAEIRDLKSHGSTQETAPNASGTPSQS